MITFVKGNLFHSAAQVLTNTVNCVGVMGKGVALEFKNRYPVMFEDYRLRCKRGEVRPGGLYLWEDDHVQILNFPTKRDWREDSRIEDIEQGLQYLSTHYQDLGIQSLAMPALGCGNGVPLFYVLPFPLCNHIRESDSRICLYKLLEPDRIMELWSCMSNEERSAFPGVPEIGRNDTFQMESYRF